MIQATYLCPLALPPAWLIHRHLIFLDHGPIEGLGALLVERSIARQQEGLGGERHAASSVGTSGGLAASRGGRTLGFLDRRRRRGSSRGQRDDLIISPSQSGTVVC